MGFCTHLLTKLLKYMFSSLVYFHTVLGYVHVCRENLLRFSGLYDKTIVCYKEVMLTR